MKSTRNQTCLRIYSPKQELVFFSLIKIHKSAKPHFSLYIQMQAHKAKNLNKPQVQDANNNVI